MPKPWEKFANQGASKPWEKYSNEDQEESNPIVAGVRSGLQGLTGNLSDELVGLGEAAGRAIGLEGIGSKSPMDISLAEGGPTLDWETLRDAYKRARDQERKALKKESEESPVITGAASLGGAIASPINKLVAPLSIAKGGAALGALSSFGASESEDLGQLGLETAGGAALGGVLGKGIEKSLPYVDKGIKSLSSGLGKKAEQLAENATGATAKQSEKFAPGAGRELLDRRIVRFGSDAEDIAERAAGAMDEANKTIDLALKELDQRGVVANIENVVEVLSKKANELKADPSKAQIVRQIEGIVDDIVNTGQSNIPISLGEQTKRGFNKIAKDWRDPRSGQAGKSAYGAYKDEVERAAQEASPEIAKSFAEAKKTYGLMAPIEEAASRRAAQLNQSPFGGLLDVASSGVGEIASQGTGILAAAGRRLISPRISSASAVTLDKISKALGKSSQMQQAMSKNPQVFNALASRLSSQIPEVMSNFNDEKTSQGLVSKVQGTKYQQVLENAARNGEASLNAAHFTLYNRDKDYRQLIDNKPNQ